MTSTYTMSNQKSGGLEVPQVLSCGLRHHSVAGRMGCHRVLCVRVPYGVLKQCCLAMVEPIWYCGKKILHISKFSRLSIQVGM